MKKNEQNQKKKLSLSKPARILIVGLIVILVPLILFLGILIHAGLTSGKPIVGSRFEGDLNPSISSSMIVQMQEAVQSLPEVEKADIQLTTAQLRVNVDTKDDASSETLKNLVQTVYEKLKTIAPIETYFTSNNGKKMYDLAINVYNKIDAEDESMIYYLLTKNATMKEASVQLVSEAVNPELAQQLRKGEDSSVTEKTEEISETNEGANNNE